MQIVAGEAFLTLLKSPDFKFEKQYLHKLKDQAT